MKEKNNTSLLDKILKVNSNFNTGVYNYFFYRRKNIINALYILVYSFDIILFMFSFAGIFFGSLFVYLKGEKNIFFYVFAIVLLISLFNSIKSEIENISEVFKK